MMAPNARVVASVTLCAWFLLVSGCEQSGKAGEAQSPTLEGAFYISVEGGNDSNDGTSAERAWQTLAHASAQLFDPGAKILLRRGDVFQGALRLIEQHGTAGSPIVVGAYGEGASPVIDSTGYLAGVEIRESGHIEVRDLEITADGGTTIDGGSNKKRYGVLVQASGGAEISDIAIRNLHIHDIYPELGSPHEGATPTTHVGTAISLIGSNDGTAPVSNVVVEGCRILRTGFKAIELKRVNSAQLLNNTMQDIGGPALQMSISNDVVVRGNLVNGSGSFSDARMHGRGSGIWPWGSNRVLIEKNSFIGARGRADSCGAHIDFNNTDVVIQHNLSLGNAGCFIEVLGNNYNCTYRYNVSINDGWRVQGETDQGTIKNNQIGHLVFISGFVGADNGVQRDFKGPYHTYIYGNTVYVKPGQTSNFVILGTTRGLLIKNNIFYLEGPVAGVIKQWKSNGSKTQNYQSEMIESVVWENNLYDDADSLPKELPFTDTAPVYGDPGFANLGGTSANDYLPAQAAVVVDRGSVITALRGDDIGIRAAYGGLSVTEDYFGNPIVGLPDYGALEVTAP